jgi:hypothetical protein
VNPIKYSLAKAMVRRSVSHSDFDPAAAERNLDVDRSIPEYNNSYYFACLGVDGTAVILRLAGRGTGAFELWFSINMPGRGCLTVPVELQKSVRSFDKSPLTIICREPEKKFELSFNGTVNDEKGRPAKVRFNAELTSAFPIFHFTNDMDPAPMARAMAAEKWTKEWFLTLRDMHQHHYEQGGDLTGTLTVDGKTRTLNMKFFRDHSFGPRTWNAMDRHVWLCMCLEDGSFVNLSLPEYPFIKIRAGFIGRDGRYTPVSESTSFAEISPGTQPPGSFGFSLDLADGRHLKASCVKGPGFTWLMDDAYRVFEWVSTFTLDGVPGRGICEFGYNVNRFDYGLL